MSNFGMLYLFEMKKILKSRLMIAMMIVTVVVVLIETISPGWSENGKVRAARMELDGRVIDDELLTELYSVAGPYGEIKGEDAEKYRDIAYFVRNFAESNTPIASYTADALYQRREELITSYMQEDALTDAEVQWWKEMRKEEVTPLTYYYNGSGLFVAQGLSGILILILLISALCLSTVFTLEHRQRMDQLLLSCLNGRKFTYLAKVLAGISVVTVCTVVSSGILTLLILALYGRNGFQALVQLELPTAIYPITMGQFVLIQVIIMITSGILFSVFAMALSEVLKNSLAVTGIMIGLFLLGQIDIIPAEYRLIKQAIAMLPTNLISLFSLNEYRLINLGGHLFSQYTVSPLLYLLLAVLFLLIGAIAYNRFQVTGR